MSAPTALRRTDALREPRRFTVEEYHAMAEAGILSEDDRVELIEGQIMFMSPIGSHHYSSVNRLNKLFVLGLQDRAVAHVQNPVRLDEGTEPEPDLTLLRPRDDFYAGRMPTPEDVLLLIEVADTSLGFDRTVKIPLYARHGISEVWLIALKEEYAEVYRRPAADGYGNITRYGRGDTLGVAALPDVNFSVDEVLG